MIAPPLGSGPGHPEGYPDPCRLSTTLAAIRAAAAAVGGFPLLAVLVDVADEHPAVYAGVGALGLVVAGRFFGRWVRVGCARLIHGGLACNVLDAA